MTKTRKIMSILWVVGMMTMIIIYIVYSFSPEPETIDGVPRPDLDNFKIENLTEEQIIKIDRFAPTFMSSSHRCGEKSGILIRQYKDTDKDTKHCRYSVRETVGIQALQVTLVKDTTLKLKIESSLGAGNAMVFIIQDDTIVESFECGGNKTLTYQVEGESIFCVKVLFEDTKDFSINIVRAFGGEEPIIDH